MDVRDFFTEISEMGSPTTISASLSSKLCMPVYLYLINTRKIFWWYNRAVEVV